MQKYHVIKEIMRQRNVPVCLINWFYDTYISRPVFDVCIRSMQHYFLYTGYPEHNTSTYNRCNVLYCDGIKGPRCEYPPKHLDLDTEYLYPSIDDYLEVRSEFSDSLERFKNAIYGIRRNRLHSLYDILPDVEFRIDEAQVFGRCFENENRYYLVASAQFTLSDFL